MENHLASLQSAVAFAGFFLAFSLSLDFWGRLVLKGLKAADASEPDGLLGIVAGAATVFVLCRWLSFFTHAFERPFACLVILGALGAALEILLGLRAPSGDPVPAPGREAVKAIVADREWAVAATAFAFVQGFCFCRLWPSGSLEPWLSPNADYYSWIFNAGYWMGYSEAENFGIPYQYPWIFDAFGTDILFAMFSSAKGEYAYVAAPGFTVALLAWIGAGAYHLARRLAGLPRWLSWLAAQGVVGGSLFWLLAVYGLYGQLAATVGYLALARAALGGSVSAPSRRAGFLRLFFPLLYLFLSYQAGYVMFACLAGGAAFLYATFSGEAAPAAGGRLAARAWRDARRAAAQILAATLVAAAASPQAAAQVARRTVSAALQKDGWGVWLLDPALFSGLPLIAELPFGLRLDVSAAEWAVFLAALAALSLATLRRGAAPFPGRDLAGLRASVALFAAAVLAYLAAFGWKGEVYQIWKFATLVALPLSFLPAALLLSALRAAARGRTATFAAALAVSAAVVAPPVLFYRNPEGPRRAVKDVRSLLPLADMVNAALYYDRGEGLVIFDLASIDRNFAALVVSQHTGMSRVGFVQETYFTPAVDDYLKLAEGGAVLYSDKVYPGLYRGSVARTPAVFTVYRYNAELLRRGGAVSFGGLEPYTMYASRRSVRLRILVPPGLAGRDLLVRIAFLKEPGGEAHSCSGPTARRDGAPLSEAVGMEGGEFLIRAPAGWQTAGSLRLALVFPELPPVPRPGLDPWDWSNPPACWYAFEAVELLPADEGASVTTKDAGQVTDRRHRAPSDGGRRRRDPRDERWSGTASGKTGLR